MKSWHDPDGTLHEIYSANVFVGGRHLGSFTYDSGRSDLGWPRHGFAYYCRHCGQVWAVIAASDPRGVSLPFEPLPVACEKHYDQWAVPGSLLYGELVNLLADLPPAAVAREFNLYLTKLVKEIDHEETVSLEALTDY